MKYLTQNYRKYELKVKVEIMLKWLACLVVLSKRYIVESC